MGEVHSMNPYKRKCQRMLRELADNPNITSLIVAYRTEGEPTNELSLITQTSVRDIMLARVSLDEILATLDTADESAPQ